MGDAHVISLRQSFCGRVINSKREWDLASFRKGQYYTRKEINGVLGGGVQDYLPHKDGAVVCSCVTPEMLVFKMEREGK
jgi:hypothetical protein